MQRIDEAKKKPTTAAGKKRKFNKVMKEKNLKTSAGDKVTDNKQRLAIAYSEANIKNKNESFDTDIYMPPLNEWLEDN